MKKPHPKRTRHQAARRVRHALMVGTGLLALPEAALAQSATCSGSAVSCTIPAGNYSQAFSTNSGSTAALTFTNNGTFAVTTSQSAISLGAVGAVANGTSGAVSDDSNRAPGAAESGGPMTFTNNGVITHSIAPLLNTMNVANSVYGASTGGNGGNYTGTDAAQSGGSAGASSNATMTNQAAITVNQASGNIGSPTILVSGAALLVDSIAGNGGDVTSKGPDSNGNPTYHTSNGAPGGAAGNVSLTNSGSVTVSLGQPLFALGYWGAAARSLGGDGGTGNNGEAGGSAGTATVINSANISVLVAGGTATNLPGIQGATPGLYALHARSQGGVGNMSVNSGNNGGAGGNAAGATITIGNSGQPLNITLNAVPPSGGAINPAAVAAISLGGDGGAGYDSSHGGYGGVAGPSTVTLNAGVTVNANGAGVMGVLSLAQGGVGGSSGVGQDNSTAGNGGSAGSSGSSTPSASISLTNATVTTSGAAAPALMAATIGGAGGAGVGYTQSFGVASRGGLGGNGGNTGPVSITTTGGVISTSGAQSIAVLASAQGGVGGVGGDVNAAQGTSGSGGYGGQAAPVTVTINAGTQIITTGAGTIGGAGAHGILASSIGGTGGVAGAINVELGGSNGVGGPGGGGYNTTVTLAAGSSVRTSGDASFGVVARSVGGAGGSGNLTGYSSGGLFGSTAPNGGAGGNSGTVLITSGAQVTTSGNSAHGLVALSLTGTGGGGGIGAGVLFGPSGSGGATGFTGSATVINTGSITTSGTTSLGIQAQSIGGNSGSAGDANGIFSVGGSGGAAANGNLATVTHSGSITTSGQGSIGILAQSIGGGGGNGGDATGVLLSVGGSGTGGGAGDTTTVTVNGSVTTTGQLAHGVVAQSIGGGGGTGGNATTAGLITAVSIGGTAGGGGDGGATVLNATGGTVTLAGSNAIGMVAQSIGGGGGTGGSAYALSSSLAFSAAHAVGGSGGSGGAGNTVTLTLSGISISTGQSTTANTNLNPVDAHGIVAQSIGGGGGVGGSATAQAFAIGVPVPGTEGNTVAVSIADGVGGSGGNGGAAGSVTVTMLGNNPGTNSITTQGQGSHGILVQSIGGGGGAGGDSSALAATLSYGRVLTAAGNYPPPPDAEAPGGPNSFSLAAAVSVGGKGQAGGAGGNVLVNISGTNVITLGDYGNAVVVQSIGGGGGNGGVGSSTTAALGSTRSVSLSIGLGGSGATGGAGGTVTGNIGSQTVLQTYGASAQGFVAQSIGGGGGTSQGSTINLGGSYTAGNGVTVSPTANVTVSVGGTGGAGGDGGTVGVTLLGRVLTSGADASGVVVQSIGGGGGIGGSAGADASSDNPISLATKVRGILNDVVEKNAPADFSAQVSVGGRGGIAGGGGALTYNQSGSITTQGDWAHGLVAQSIGGGGGMGGVANSNASGVGFSGLFSLGGSGGASGGGGAVTLQFTAGSSINTGVAGISGYAAFGVLGQSIGGGGGTAADGSANTGGTVPLVSIGLGAGLGGTGGAAGASGLVTLEGSTTIVTRGDVGVAVLLQSIGGGGGLAGNGSGLSTTLPTSLATTRLQVGGGAGASGNSGGVAMNATLNIQTSGAHAYGVLAQGIGGGGGFGFTSNLSTAQYANAGGLASSGAVTGTGGGVRLTLTGGAIQTSGFAAHGIVAQSIGGGGGIAGLPSSAAVTMATSNYAGAAIATAAPVGIGGIIAITSSAPITTRGDLAYGILAQSIGGGGGLVVNGNQLYAGVTFVNAGLPFTPSNASTVTVIQSAPIMATGLNSVGIFAQSRGSGSDGAVSVDVQASVQGGSGPQGVAVWVDSRNTTSGVLIEPGASLSALSGNALLMTAGRAQNQGTVTGNVTIGNGGSFINQGTHNTGTTADVAEYVNTGLVAIATHRPFGVTTLTGNFTQGATGRLVLDADFTGRRSDVMVVQGAAVLDGRVRPLISSVLPYVQLPFLVVNGPVTGQLQGEQTSIFSYDVSRKGGTYNVSAQADFTPAGYSLSRNAASMAGHLQSAWDAGGAGLGSLFALLGNAADARGEGAYTAALRQISPNSSLAPGARMAAGGRAFANAAMSCPQFEGSTAMLTEGECVWAGLTGRTAAQASSDGLSSFRLNSTTWQAAGQRSLGGGWFLGGSIAYENARLTTTDGLNGGRGQSGFAAVTAKYQTGPWLFAGAVFGGGGEFNSTRSIQLPGFGSIARGSPTMLNAGAVLRATYTVGGEEFYLRPSLSLSLVHARSGAYAESGAGVLNLNVSAASNTVGGLTPALEVGGRAVLPNGVVMRVYTAAGASLLSEGRWSQQSRLASAPAAAGAFSSVVRTDQVVGRVTAGVQVFATERLEVRLQYEGEYSANLTGHGGSFAVAYRF